MRAGVRLLVAVKGGSAPSDEVGGVFGSAAFGSGVGDELKLVSDDLRVGKRAAEAELLHPRPLNDGLAAGGHISEDVALLHASGDERVDLELASSSGRGSASAR